MGTVQAVWHWSCCSQEREDEDCAEAPAVPRVESFQTVLRDSINESGSQQKRPSR